MLLSKLPIQIQDIIYDYVNYTTPFTISIDPINYKDTYRISVRYKNITYSSDNSFSRLNLKFESWFNIKISTYGLVLVHINHNNHTITLDNSCEIKLSKEEMIDASDSIIKTCQRFINK